MCQREVNCSLTSNQSQIDKIKAVDLTITRSRNYEEFWYEFNTLRPHITVTEKKIC